MSNIIKFPRASKRPTETREKGDLQPTKLEEKQVADAHVVRWGWILFVLVWPVARWIIAIDVFIQFVRMMIHWSTPGMNAGWVFLGHFAVLVACTYFVSVFRPKGV